MEITKKQQSLAMRFNGCCFFAQRHFSRNVIVTTLLVGLDYKYIS